MAKHCDKCNICKHHRWDLENYEGDDSWTEYCISEKHCLNGDMFELRQHSTWTMVV